MKINKILFRVTGAFALSAIILSPALASAASQTGSSTINANIGSAITVTTSGTVAVSLTPTSGGVVSSASDTVTVATNNATGYALTFSDGDTVTNLTNGSDTITPHTGTFGTPTALAVNKWGYRVVGAGGFTATAYGAELNASPSTSTWAGVPSSATPQTLKTTATTTASDVTTVWYGIKVDSSKASGTYTDTVTYTATTN